MNNNYFKWYTILQDGANNFQFDFFYFREILTFIYAWAIPDPEILKIIAQHSPILEIGSGRGYWAKLLEHLGVDILCLDNEERWQYFFSFERRYENISSHLISVENLNIINIHLFKEQMNNDLDFLRKNHYWKKPIETSEKSLHEMVELNKFRSLFLCWPPYDDPLAFESLKSYKGDTVIFIGESRDGCTGDQQFFDLLDKEWGTPAYSSMPRWPAIWDAMSIYKR